MRTRQALAATAVAVVALTTAACGSSSGGDSGGDGSGKGSVTIGFSQRKLAGSDWYKTLIDGAKAAAADAGVELRVTDAGGDAVRQNSDIQTMITSGVDAVIVNPADPTGLTSSVTQLATAKIPLVVVNSNLDENLAPKAYCYVAEDQKATAALVGEAVAARLDATGRADGPITGAAIGGFSGEVVTQLRVDGFLSGFNSYWGQHGKKPDVTILPTRYGEWAPDKALPQMRDVATANPGLSFVYSASDVMLPGIVSGLDSAGLKDVVIGTYDGQMSVLKEMMDNPDGRIQADASNDPYKQGQLAVQMALAAVHGEKTCDGGTNYIDTFVATPETASKYYDANRTF
jgi:ribose transport system substrate-binding protein